MSILTKIRQHGFSASFKKAIFRLHRKIKSIKLQMLHRNAPIYKQPTESELTAIENALLALGVAVLDYEPDPLKFKKFKSENWFPSDYHGGLDSGVWDEKLLEHWISSELLGVMGYGTLDTYVDIAASGSPWVKTLRERKNVNAYAIDLQEIGDSYRNLPFYLIQNAVSTSFDNASITGASLHCAFEMFMKTDDTLLIKELARILKPRGKAVILPLYMHTHYCAYSTPEYYSQGHSDPLAKEYIRWDSSGVPSSRKYDPAKLKERVLDPILASGLRYRVLALRNKNAFGSNIYCHFIIEIEK